MKGTILMLLAGVLCAVLAGCEAPPPSKAADGIDWNEAWVTVGNVIGVDTPASLTARENNDALAANGMYYAAWSIGEAVPYVNEDKEEAELYDAQIYLLLAGHTSQEQAEETAEEWLSMAQERYTVNETTEVEQELAFIVLAYTYDSEGNPYERGASAFGVYGNYAISVECSCQEGFEGDPKEILEEFLVHCHYAA